MNSKLSNAKVLGPPKKYPTVVSFDEQDLPAIKGWKVGGEYQIVLKVKQISSRIGEDYMDSPDEKPSNAPTMRASFKVLSAEAEEDDSASKPKNGRADLRNVLTLYFIR